MSASSLEFDSCVSARYGIAADATLFSTPDFETIKAIDSAYTLDWIGCTLKDQSSMFNNAGFFFSAQR